jgi:microcystin degradation protein MlrC
MLHDPDAVATAIAAGVGGTIQRSLGGRTTPLYGAGVALSLYVASVTETAEAGQVAILQSGTVDILVGSRRPPRVSPDLLASAGISIASYALVALKAGEIARAEFAGIAAKIVSGASPGPANPDLMRLPFHYVPANRRATGAAPSFPAPRPEGAQQAAPAPRSRGFVPLDQPGPEQTYQRHEERRANSQQKRTEAFGAQRR